MKHFEVEQWLDFVRGLNNEAARTPMQQHLSCCKKCGRVVETLRKLTSAASADAAYQVPDYAVRSARAVYALHRPESIQILPRLMAKLVFDSFRNPVLVGVRSQHRITRQAVYEAGDYCVDLQIEREYGAPSVVLQGQIANRAQPSRQLGNIPIVLMSGKQVLGRTLSNRLGEFQIEYQPKESLRLHIPVQQAGKQIEVRLNRLHKGKS